MSYAECLAKTRSFIKARRLYMKVRKWRDDDWYRAWPNGLGDECEAAAAAW